MKKCPPSIKHVPDPSIEYQPGTDKEGWAIVPADVAPSPFPEGTFETTQMGLNIPISPFAPGVAAQGAIDPRFDLSETQAQIGMLEVDQDGTMRLNGQTFDATTYDTLAECE